MTDQSANVVKTTEIAVEMTCESCASAVSAALSPLQGIRNFRIDVPAQRVFVDGLVSDSALLEAVQSTGRRARIVGHGSSVGVSLGAAVAELKFCPALGVVRFTQLEKHADKQGHDALRCLVEGDLSGLSPGAPHGLQVHETGDISDDWRSVGDVHPDCVIGDVIADEKGNASFVKEVAADVADIIGRALVVHSLPNPSDGATNASPGLAWAVIARSAGKGENPKTLCTCDGTVIWNA